MSKPIYILVVAKGYTEAWYQLSKEEQDDLWSKVQEVDRRAGAKWLIGCDRAGRMKMSLLGQFSNIPTWKHISRRSKDLKNCVGGGTFGQVDLGHKDGGSGVAKATIVCCWHTQGR